MGWQGLQFGVSKIDNQPVMDEIIKRLKRLPKEPLTCQGEILSWPVLVRGDDGLPFELRFPLWIQVESGLVYTDPEAFHSADRDPLDAALKSLLEFVEQLTDGARALNALKSAIASSRSICGLTWRARASACN